MPPPTSPSSSGWKLGAAYTAFGVFAFLFFLYLTFPYAAFRDRMVAEARRAGFDVSIGDIGPGLMGITATAVRIERPRYVPASGGVAASGPAAEPVEILINKVRFGPSFVPLGLAFEAQVFGGQVEGAVGGVGNGSVQLQLEKLDTAKGDLKGLMGVDLSGTIDGKLMLTVPLAEKTETREYDLTQADGTLELQLRGLTINGGTITVPMYGTPTPLDLPKVQAGDLKAEITFEKGLGTVTNFTSVGEDVSLRSEGTLKLGKTLQHSEANLDLKVRADQEFIKRLGIIGSGLSILPPDKMDPAFRVAKITGLLMSPRFTPGPR